MAEVTYYCDDTADGSVYSAEGSYDSASWYDTAHALRVGRLNDRYNESFFSFDLTDPASGDAIPAGATINSVDLSLYAATGDSALSSSRTLWVCRYDWGASIDTGDFRTAAQMTALLDSGDGVFASVAVSSGWPSSSGQHAFAEGSAAAADVAACIASTLPLILFDQNHIDAVSGGNDYINFQSADNATATYHPRLVIDYTEGGGGIAIPVVRHHLQMQGG